jgi:plastocyanin
MRPLENVGRWAAIEMQPGILMVQMRRLRPGPRKMVVKSRALRRAVEEKGPRKQRPLSITGIVILTLAAIAAITYYLGSPPTQPSIGSTNTTGTSQAVTIVIPDGVGVNQTLHYLPPSIAVVVGVNNTIVWSDQDTSSAHDVISVSAPPNGPEWNFENMVAGKDYSVTLTVPGTYSYEMYLPYVVVGMITVKAAA